MKSDATTRRLHKQAANILGDVVREGLQENEFGGRSLIVTAGRNLDALAEDYRSILSPQDIAVYQDKDRHFAKCAKRCRLPGMRKWLEAIAGSDRWHLELARANDELEDITEAIFWFEECGGVLVAKGGEEADVPKWLAHVYEFVAETTTGFGVAGGLQPAVSTLADGGYESVPNLDASRTFAFWQSTDAEVAFAYENWALTLDRGPKIIGELPATLDKLFECQLDGTSFEDWLLDQPRIDPASLASKRPRRSTKRPSRKRRRR